MRLYIDPGTGSMLFTVLLGVIGAAVYSLKMFWIKMRYKTSGGKVQKSEKTIPIAIFSDDKRYWTIFEPICREMDKLGKEIFYMTLSEDDPALTNCYQHVHAEFIGNDNKAFTKLNFLNATILLSTTPGLDVYQWKRSKDVKFYVHIPHAASEIVLYRMFGIDYYDAILLSGDYQIENIRKLEEIRCLPPKELVKVGIPYMDEMQTRLRNADEIEEHPVTVLLAPSWGPSAIFSVYGEKIIDVLLTTGYKIVIRPHPQSFKSEKELMDKLMNKYPESVQIEWNRDLDNFEVLRRTDILISDFSGIVFEYALIHDKPVIYTDPCFNVDVYDAWWLEEQLWTISALPRIGEELNDSNMEKLKEIIDSCLKDKKRAEDRKNVKDETWAYCGEGNKRVVEYLLNKYDELTCIEEEK